MNIKDLAKEAGLKRHQEQAPGIDGAVGSWEELEQFAELVAAHEREECIQNVLQQHEGFGTEHQGVEYVKQRIVVAIRARSKA
jgi:hypothetical protein